MLPHTHRIMDEDQNAYHARQRANDAENRARDREDAQARTSGSGGTSGGISLVAVLALVAVGWFLRGCFG